MIPILICLYTLVFSRLDISCMDWQTTFRVILSFNLFYQLPLLSPTIDIIYIDIIINFIIYFHF